MSELNVGIKFANQLTDQGHVDRSRHDMNAVGADVGSEFDFPHHNAFLC